MKMPLTKHYCISKECVWEEVSHRMADGIRCPKCDGPVMSERVDGKMKYRHKAVCLACDHSGMVYHESKEDYQEVRVCPKYNCVFVDIWKLMKYNRKVSETQLNYVETVLRRELKGIDKEIEHMDHLIKEPAADLQRMKDERE